MSMLFAPKLQNEIANGVSIECVAMLAETLCVLLQVALTTNVRLSQPKDQAALDTVIDDTEPGHVNGAASLCVDPRSLNRIACRLDLKRR